MPFSGREREIRFQGQRKRFATHACTCHVIDGCTETQTRAVLPALQLICQCVVHVRVHMVEVRMHQQILAWMDTAGLNDTTNTP